MYKKSLKRILAGLCLVLLLGTAGCSKKNEENTIRVGTKDFTENLIVGEIYALALEDAGYQVERVFDIAGSVVHTSITSDEIDVYPEYTGTGLLNILQLPMMTDPEEVYQTVKKEYEKQFDLVWLDYAQANDGQGLVIRTEAAETYGIRTISELQKYADKLRFASQGDFDQREDGIPALTQVYGAFHWKSSTVYDGGLKYTILENDEADVAPAYTTEGQLVQPEFTLLEDDKHVWPPYNLAPIVRKETLDLHPDMAEILNGISAGLDTQTVTRLNAEVDVEKREYEEVAKEYYDSLK